MRAAAFVADPTGDADEKPAIEVGDQFVALAGETVHDRTADPAANLVHAREEIRVRVALVQEQRLAAVDRDSQLALERGDLRRTWRQIAEIVEPGLADRLHFRRLAQFTQQRIGRVVVVAGMMRVHARGRIQQVRVRTRQFMRGTAAARAGAGHDDPGDAMRACAFEDRVEIRPEMIRGQDWRQCRSGACGISRSQTCDYAGTAQRPHLCGSLRIHCGAAMLAHIQRWG